MERELQKGIDYEFDERGLMVFTRHYLLEREYCCGSGCKNCPYGHSAVERKQESDLTE